MSPVLGPGIGAVASVRGVVITDSFSLQEMVNRWMKIMKKRWFWCFQPVETGCENSSKLHFLQAFLLAKALKIESESKFIYLHFVFIFAIFVFSGDTESLGTKRTIINLVGPRTINEGDTDAF